METLDLATRTLYQELQEAALLNWQLEHNPLLNTCYVLKKLKGNEYFYHQQRIDGKNVQEYLGPKKDYLSFVETEKTKKDKLKENYQANQKSIKNWLKMLRARGFLLLDTYSFNLLKALASKTLIYEKGVLIGSFAFACYGPLLGYIFDSSSLKTQDIDLVRDAKLLEKFDNKLEANFDFIEWISNHKKYQFIEVPGLSLKQRPYSFKDSQGLSIDILTPLRGRAKSNYLAPGLQNTGAQALRFLDYLIEETITGLIFGQSSAIPVTIPRAERFACHKLLVAAERGQYELAKREKDLLQASQLFKACARHDLDSLKEAKDDLFSRGKKWQQRFEKSLKNLEPEIRSLLN